jgi:hypothetical protein
MMMMMMSLTLMLENISRIFENNVFKGILEPKKEEEPNIGENCIPVIRRFII